MRFIDLFAGLGGFHVALDRLGHGCVFASELDTNLQLLYEKNFGMRPHGDIRTVPVSKIPVHEILCAGSPCQPLLASGISSGAIFRGINRHGQVKRALTSQVVALQVKRYAALAGLDASLFSGHSLRAGLCTSAALNGASERKIMDQTRHRSSVMVRKYIRDSNLFRDNAAGTAGL
jgi:integrase